MSFQRGEYTKPTIFGKCFLLLKIKRPGCLFRPIRWCIECMLLAIYKGICGWECAAWAANYRQYWVMVSGSRCCTGISVNVSASSARPYNTWPRNPPSFDSNAKHAANSRLHCSLECTLNLCCFDLPPPPAPPALFGRARGKIFRVNTRANVKSKHAKNSMVE